MRSRVRHYDHAADYERVGRFLVRTYRTTGGHINWLQPRWEYMHYHPLIRGVDLSSIGIWEAHGEVVGVVHPEHAMGTAYFEIDSEWGALKAEMGYVKDEGREAMSHFTIPRPFPTVSLPPGFRLKGLADDNDLRKVDRVLWRGFNHGDEPPDGGIEDRKFMQSAPNYRKDLNIVVEVPGGDFASYCGMWYEPVHSIAYVEPVATDPDYRRMGLGRAAVLEGIRRCGELGATVACVGSVMPFYLSMGFRQAYNCSVWQREWAGEARPAGRR